MKRTNSSVARQMACNAGFAVAELVAAAAILFSVLVGVLGAVEYAGASTRMASMREGAIDVATDQIESDRNIPYYQLGVKYDDGSVSMQGANVPAVQTVTTDRGTYTVSTEVWWPETTKTTYKNVRVTVAWTEPTAGRISVETAVFGDTDIGNVGDVQIHMVDVENPTVKVSGARIILHPHSGSDMTALGNTDGVAFFGQTPIGTATFPDPGTVNPTWLVDVSGLGSPSISAGFQDLGYVYCQKPCTAKIHVRSTNVPSVWNATVTLKDTDRNITYTAKTDANGDAYFSAVANTVNGTAGLWLSGGGGYTATATKDSASSAPGTFSLTAGGQDFNTLTLTITDPPSITVSKKVSTTGNPLNGVTWTVTLKNPSGVSLGTHTTTADSVTFQTTVAGDYTAIVTGVSGFADNPGFTFRANATDQNQACVVPMQPVFEVGVRLGGVGLPDARVTVTNTSTHVSIPSVSGANPGTTGSDGRVKFPVPAAGTYSVSAVYNGVTYPGPDVSLTGGSSFPTYFIDITEGAISVGVVPGGGWWSRYVAIYDSNDDFVAYDTATRSDPTVTFTVPPGMYTVVVCGTRASLPLPSTRPNDRSRTYKNYYMTPPGVPTDGSTYSFTDLYAPN
jgi:hypothetical protein